MSESGHSLPICFVLASYNVSSTPKADIRFQRNIRRDGPDARLQMRRCPWLRLDRWPTMGNSILSGGIVPR